MAIDVQNEWTRFSPTTVFRLSAAIHDLRQRMPILWVYFMDDPQRSQQWPKPRWNNQIFLKPKHPRAPRLKPDRDEWVFFKDDRDAFTNPQLMPLLHKQGINHLIIGGFLSSQCVWSTMLGAREAGLRVTFAADLSADFRDKNNLEIQACTDQGIRWHQRKLPPP